MRNSLNRPWYLRIPAIASFVFALSTMVLSGSGHMRLVGMVFAACALYYMLFLRRGDWLGQYQPEVKWYTAWALWALVTGLIVADYWELYWHNAKILMQMVVMIWSAVVLMRHEHQDEGYVYFAFFIGACVQVLGCVLGYQNEMSQSAGSAAREVVREVVDENTRMRGLTMNENALGDAMFMGVTAVILLWNWRFLIPRWLMRMGLIGMIPFFCYYAMRAGSRQTIIVIGCLLTGWLVWVLPRMYNVVVRQFLRFAFCVLMIFGGTATVHYMMEYTVVGTRIRQHLDRGGVVGGAQENVRWFLYVQGFEMWARHPIAGVGLGHYVANTLSAHYSHSDYLEPLGCTGLVGFILYHLWSGLIYFRLWRLLMVRGLTIEDRYKIQALLLFMTVRYISGFFTPHWTHQQNQLLLATVSVVTWKLRNQYLVRRRPLFWY